MLKLHNYFPSGFSRKKKQCIGPVSRGSNQFEACSILFEVGSVGSAAEPPQEFNLTSNFSIDLSNQENKVSGRKGLPEASVLLSIHGVPFSVACLASARSFRPALIKLLKSITTELAQNF